MSPKPSTAVFPSPLLPLVDAVLACEFKTEKDQNPRIEWKKKGKGVTFVYFDGSFSGEPAVPTPQTPPHFPRIFPLSALLV